MSSTTKRPTTSAESKSVVQGKGVLSPGVILSAAQLMLFRGSVMIDLLSLFREEGFLIKGWGVAVNLSRYANI